MISKKENVQNGYLKEDQKLNIYFEHNKAEVSDEQISRLKGFLKYQGSIEIEGFTSRPGSEGLNQNLRLTRAISVANIIKLIEPERLVKVNQRKDPVWIFETESLNRRVNIQIRGEENE